jgi:hypothetical protein
MWGATEDITAILQDKLGEDTIFRGRFFFCCVAQRIRLDGTKSVGFSNVFVPTLCGRCARRTAAQNVAEDVRLEKPGTGDESTPDIEIELHPSLLEGWAAFKAVQMYCEDRVSSYQHIIDHRIIQHEIQKFYLRMQTAKLEFNENREEMCLKVLSYSDPGFF